MELTAEHEVAPVMSVKYPAGHEDGDEVGSGHSEPYIMGGKAFT